MNSTTLENAIKEVFGIDFVPEFKDYKPSKQAREWLKREGKDFTYERGVVGDGIVITVVGSGTATYHVSNGSDSFKGRTIIGTISPVRKATKRSKTIKADPQLAQDNMKEPTPVEPAPEVENPPVEDDKPEMTVTSEDAPKPRKTRRSK